MKQRALLRSQAHPLRLAGPIIEARLPGVTVGEICHIYASRREKQTIARAQVLGFNRDVALLSLTGSAKGLSREAVIAPAGHGLNIVLRPDLAGSVLDATGNIVQRLAASSPTAEQELRAIDSRPPEWHQRIAIGQPFVTGIRAIDGLLTCGVGQRLGIFAAAGCGKTTLMHMLIANADADIFVIALIGERGREVTEFVSALRHSARQQQCIVVSATSDYSALDRCNAALVATTVAEYFRDQGKKVVLFFDSVTRFARALRDVALAAGEFPARRGFPASVLKRCRKSWNGRAVPAAAVLPLFIPFCWKAKRRRIRWQMRSDRFWMGISISAASWPRKITIRRLMSYAASAVSAIRCAARNISSSAGRSGACWQPWKRCSYCWIWGNTSRVRMQRTTGPLINRLSCHAGYVSRQRNPPLLTAC